MKISVIINSNWAFYTDVFERSSSCSVVRKFYFVVLELVPLTKRVLISLIRFFIQIVSFGYSLNCRKKPQAHKCNRLFLVKNMAK